MRKRYDGLIGMRGLGALMVVAYHVLVIRGFVGKSTLLDMTIGKGGNFVQMFFILSAFSCMCGYFESFTKNLNAEILSNFYIRRVKKLIPTFWFALLCHCLLILDAGKTINIYSAFGSASLLYGFLPQFRESMVSAGWSLGIEVVFYLAFPAFTIACLNKKRTIGTLVFSILMMIAYFNYYAVGTSATNNSEMNIVRQLAYFVVGALLYHYIDDIEAMTKGRKWLYFVLLGVQIVSLILLSKLPRLARNILIMVMFSAMTINQIGYKDYLFDNKLLKWFGKNSYQVYLFHMIIFNLLLKVDIWVRIEAKFGWLIHFLSFLACELVLTALFCALFNALYRKIEKAFRKEG